MKKINKIGLLRDNPSMTFEEWNKKTGGSKNLYGVYKATLKRAATKPAVKKARKTRQVKKEKMVLAIQSLPSPNQKFHDEIADLKHQIVGFRAVISYLENQLGLRGSQ